MTHENELTAPVDLCTPDGERLNATRSAGRDDRCTERTSRVTSAATSGGTTGRCFAGDLVVSAVYADVDHFGLADVWWADLSTGASGGHAIVAGRDAGFALPERPGTAPLRIDRDGLALDIVDDETGTRLTGTWTEPDGRPGRLDVRVALPPGHESLNVVIPWDDTTFNYTSKHQARRPRERCRSARSDGRSAARPATRGACWTSAAAAGRPWPAEIAWNWGGGAGRAGAHVVGLQFGAKWNGALGIHRERHHRRRTADQDRQRARLAVLVGRADGNPGASSTPAGSSTSRLPRGSTSTTNLPGRDKGSETHQVFGTWSGRLRTDDGLELVLEGLQGFAEEARQEW